MAAYVWKTVAIGERCASLAQLARYTEWNSDAGFAVWELEASPTWILAEDMLDPCIFCWLGPQNQFFLGACPSLRWPGFI